MTIRVEKLVKELISSKANFRKFKLDLKKVKLFVEELRKNINEDEWRVALREIDLKYDTDCLNEFDKFDNGIIAFFDLLEELKNSQANELS
ncbi:MAG: hypothetical protein PHF86_04500 [Candidatus Nanoarchaeia archaeon]|jgi:hypothetical protein|nr:hypothetical protein [Candidatus Nanoarchaeia archaeon]